MMANANIIVPRFYRIHRRSGAKIIMYLCRGLAPDPAGGA